MQVRLVGSDLGVFLKDTVRVQALVGFVGVNLKVDAVAEDALSIVDRRLVADREKFEAEQQARLAVASAGMNVCRYEYERGTGAQQFSRVFRKDIRVAADFVDRPVSGSLADGFQRLAGGESTPHHVMKHVTRSNGLPAAVSLNVVDFTNFDGLHIAILRETRGDRVQLAPPIRRARLDGDLFGRDHQVGLT